MKWQWKLHVECFVDNGTSFGATHQQTIWYVPPDDDGFPDFRKMIGEHAEHRLIGLAARLEPL